jgi:hypothetical protein
MKTADALMVIYYVVLSGVLVFTLGYLAGWRHAKRGNNGANLPVSAYPTGSTRTSALKATVASCSRTSTSHWCNTPS